MSFLEFLGLMFLLAVSVALARYRARHGLPTPREMRLLRRRGRWLGLTDAQALWLWRSIHQPPMPAPGAPEPRAEPLPYTITREELERQLQAERAAHREAIEAARIRPRPVPLPDDERRSLAAHNRRVREWTEARGGGSEGRGGVIPGR